MNELDKILELYAKGKLEVAKLVDLYNRNYDIAVLMARKPLKEEDYELYLSSISTVVTVMKTKKRLSLTFTTWTIRFLAKLWKPVVKIRPSGQQNRKDLRAKGQYSQ